MNQRTHEQSRWELVSVGIVSAFVAAVAATLITLSLTVPVTDPRNEPQIAVTQYAEES